MKRYWFPVLMVVGWLTLINMAALEIITWRLVGDIAMAGIGFLIMADYIVTRARTAALMVIVLHLMQKEDDAATEQQSNQPIILNEGDSQ